MTMADLLHDLRKLDPNSYEGYGRVILKYALSLAEIVANDRRTRMTIEGSLQVPEMATTLLGRQKGERARRWCLG